jgi:hypothetical protein
MKELSYRGFEIDCSVKGFKRGKASLRWTCIVRIQATDGTERSDLEITLTAWSASAARAEGFKHAHQYIDEHIEHAAHSCMA